MEVNTHNIEEIKEYLRNNLRLTVKKKPFGFNGSHIELKLMLENEVLSEEYIDIKNDDG